MGSVIPTKSKLAAPHGAVLQVRAIRVGAVEGARLSVALWTQSLSRTAATGRKDGKNLRKPPFEGGNSNVMI
jgi:hypothetical protein